jgi:hypothetical protein
MKEGTVRHSNEVGRGSRKVITETSGYLCVVRVWQKNKHDVFR